MKKRSIIVSGHATSVTLEEEFWTALNKIAQQKNKSISVLVSEIDAVKTAGNLSSAIRLYVLKTLQQ